MVSTDIIIKQTMDSATLATITSAFSIATSLFLVLVFGWVVWRSESLHVLVRRVWRLVHGDQQIADPAIRSFIDEQTSLVSFRLFAGVPVASLKEAHQLIEWANLNGVQMRTLWLCGEYFDPALRQVRVTKLPSLPWRIAKFTALSVTAIITALGVATLSSDQLLMSLKATSTPFLATSSKVQAFRPPWAFSANPLRLADCSESASALAVHTTFTEQEVNLLCDFLKSESSPAFVKKGLSEQRWSLVLCALVAGWLSWQLLFALARSSEAHHLARRNLNPSLSGDQLKFDWRD